VDAEHARCEDRRAETRTLIASKGIPYWIQRADYSATDYDAAEVAEGLRAFETHDWRTELELYGELERDGSDCCPPGIGFVDPDGDILHVCLEVDGRATVHYDFTAPGKLFGLIPWSRWRVETWKGVPRSDVLDLIRFFFDGQRDWMLQKLGTSTAGDRR